jgi:predicted Fe-S protein YdhL (DUF1289 family)
VHEFGCQGCLRLRVEIFSRFDSKIKNHLLASPVIRNLPVG